MPTSQLPVLVCCLGLVACSVPIDETFDKNVKINLGQDRQACSTNGFDVADRIITTEEGDAEAWCIWNANQSGSTCTLSVHCLYHISLKRIANKLEPHKDKLEDKLTINSLEGTVSHVKFVNKGGEDMDQTVTFQLSDFFAVMLSDYNIDFVGIEKIQELAQVADTNNLPSDVVEFMRGAEIEVGPNDPLELNAPAPEEAEAFILDVLKTLPEQVPAWSYVEITFNADDTETQSFFDDLMRWVINVKGEVSAIIDVP